MQKSKPEIVGAFGSERKKGRQIQRERNIKTDKYLERRRERKRDVENKQRCFEDETKLVWNVLATNNVAPPPTRPRQK